MVVAGEKICYDSYGKEVERLRDIPVFTTEYGVASLILKELPYRQTAYVRLQDVQPGQLDQMLSECVGFCRAAGAEKIYASGHEELERYPLHTAIWQMRGVPRWSGTQMPELWPVLPENAARWRQIYNERMHDVDNAAYLSAADEKRLAESSGACFVHRGEKLLGIGWVEEDELLAIAAVEPGAGEQVARALLSRTQGSIQLQVASTNYRAVRLYERLGLVKTAEISRWYQIF